MKVLSPLSSFPAWRSSKGTRNPQRIWLWRQARFHCKTSIETPVLEGRHKISCTPGHRGKEQWPHRWLNQTYPLLLQGLLQRYGAVVSHCRDKSTGSSTSKNYPFMWAPLEVSISPSIEPVDSRAGSPQATQTGEECSPTHQQINWLKFYWAWPY